MKTEDEGGSSTWYRLSKGKRIVNVMHDYRPKGIAKSSMAAGLMENASRIQGQEAADEEEVQKNATAVAYSGKLVHLVA